VILDEASIKVCMSKVYSDVRIVFCLYVLSL